MTDPEPCTVGRYLRDIPDPYRTILVDLMADDGHHGGLSADRLAKLMREAGLKTSATAIRLHRAGTCVCS